MCAESCLGKTASKDPSLSKEGIDSFYHTEQNTD